MLREKIIVYFVNRTRNVSKLWGKVSTLTLKYVTCIYRRVLRGYFFLLSSASPG